MEAESYLDQNELESTRFRTRSRTHTGDLASLLPLGDLIALGTHSEADPAALMQEVAEAAHRILGLPQVHIRLRNLATDELEAVAFAGVPARRQEWLRSHPTAPDIYQALLQPIYHQSASYVIPPDVQVEEPRVRHAYGRRNRRVRPGGTVLVPLRGRGDRLLGVIFVRAPAEDDGLPLASIQILEAIARQAALGLEHARLYARTARLLAKEQLLAELGRDVSATLDLSHILNRTVAHLKMAYQRATVMLLNDRQELEVVAASGQVDADTWIRRLEVGELVTDWIVRHGAHLLSNNLDTDQRLRLTETHLGQRSGVCAALGVPLRAGGQIIGTLLVLHDAPHSFTYEDADLMEAIATQVSGPIATSRLYAQGQQLAAQLQRRADQLTVLNALAQAATSTLIIEQALAEATDQIRRGFGYDQVDLYLVDDERRELVLTACAHRDGPVVPVPDYRQRADMGVLGRAVRTARTQHVDDVLRDRDYYPSEKSALTRSKLCVPIMSGSRVIGVLNLESQLVSAFSVEDVGVLETSADVLAGAIENARLYRRSQEAAVLEERNRLARDLHDSVSQQLFSMTLTAQAARAQIDKNPARASALLERLQETATAALGEMRALIYQLRPPSLADHGLVVALQQHAQAISRREGLQVRFEACGDERAAHGIEQALYRILQEALNNVVKHAGAHEVDVQLTLGPEQVQLRVHDNGRGFDLAAPPVGPGQHLGLLGMRERAAELGGILELHSTPGIGTDVCVTVPAAGRRTDERSARNGTAPVSP